MKKFIPPLGSKDKPPMLGSWKRLYILLLIENIIIVGLLYWFSNAFI